MIEILSALSQAGRTSITKRPITNLKVLNEAYEYAKPSQFSRGTRVDFNGVALLLISGTGSIDEHGVTIHAGDFKAQLRRVFHNIKGLLESEGCTWHDVVRTNCYLREMERDYDAFNEVRSEFFRSEGLHVPPASTAIQTVLCRPDLLVEIDAIAMFHTGNEQGEGR